MLKKLQQHWGVNGWRFFLILCTFAVTGTFTAWVSKGITDWIDAEKYSMLWWGLKILVLLIGYQVFILFFGFCFGQFSFFWKYEKKLLARMGVLRRSKSVRIAIFASGAGSNAGKIMEYFSGSPEVAIALVVCNKPGAGVLDIAKRHGVPTFLVNRQDMDGARILAELQKQQIDFIVLAGYLWMMPPAIVSAYPKKIINIHPALLPKYGGKGMYGQHVHEAVIRNGEKESGITIHYVDEVYDNGEIIFQQKCPVEVNDTPATLAEKIHALEHSSYPRVIGSILKKQNRR